LNAPRRRKKNQLPSLPLPPPGKNATENLVPHFNGGRRKKEKKKNRIRRRRRRRRRKEGILDIT
jgi:hypothetical protein